MEFWKEKDASVDATVQGARRARTRARRRGGSKYITMKIQKGSAREPKCLSSRTSRDNLLRVRRRNPHNAVGPILGLALLAATVRMIARVRRRL